MTPGSQEFLLLCLALVSLFGLFFVSTFLHVVRRRRKDASLQFLQATHPPLYFRIHKILFNDKIDTLLFCLTCVQHTLRVFYFIFLCSAFFGSQQVSQYIFSTAWSSPIEAMKFLSFLFFLIVTFILIADLLPRMWAYYEATSALRLSSFFASFFLLLFLPFTFLFFRLIRLISPQATFSPLGEILVSSKEKLIELIRDVDDGNLLNEHDKKLLHSVLYFRDRIAREVMVPRVDLFCIGHNVTIREAARLLEEQGYSRVPVYKNSIDEIVGVLMYKDILIKYMEALTANHPNFLNESVETITKNVLYTPETKKLSQLLQDFRKKQTHMAIVVDEYGGTAGIVTIEDILEEIVGEIADEYDEETALFRPAEKNSWIIDARMNLLDLEEELNIKIPQEGDYDTIAGYIFYRLGTIPEKGTVIHHDIFELEILSSNDRVVEKVKITTNPPRIQTKKQL